RSAHQLPSSHRRRNSEVVPVDKHTQYRSASNRLLAGTADRTPKTFAVQGDPSRSTFVVIQALSLYGLPWQAETSHGII
ncbi:hypothetical protein AVEN_40439-1, partial [Araneus ventricosus]